MINEVLLEHETPSLDDSEQGLLERSGIHAEPYIKHCSALSINFMVEWIRVFLEPKITFGKGRYTPASLATFTNPITHTYLQVHVYHYYYPVCTW